MIDWTHDAGLKRIIYPPLPLADRFFHRLEKFKSSLPAQYYWLPGDLLRSNATMSRRDKWAGKEMISVVRDGHRSLETRYWQQKSGDRIVFSQARSQRIACHPV